MRSGSAGTGGRGGNDGAMRGGSGGGGRAGGRGGEHGEDGGAVGALIELLLWERRGVDPGAGRWTGAGGAGGPEGCLDAAAALAAGEPKRALAVLDATAPEEAEAHALVRAPDRARLVRALRAAAVAMDGHWQPGTSTVPLRAAVVAAQAATRGDTAAAVASVTDPRLRLAAHLAGRHRPVLLSARMTIGHGRSGSAAQEASLRYGGDAHWTERDSADAVREPLTWFDALYEAYEGYGAHEVHGAHEGGGPPGSGGPRHADLLAHHLLLAADLRVRGGDRPAAEPWARSGRDHASGSPASAGFTALLVGDWRLGTPGTAEQCALGAPPGERALSRASAQYKRARALYQDARSASGQAAALLRLAHVERLRGGAEACRGILDEALELALAGGDGAYAVLIRVHQELDAIDAGADSRATTEGAEGEGGVGGAVVRWARTDGSTSWLRGLRQLVVERAEFWSTRGDAVRAGRAVALARGLDGDGGAADGAGEAGRPTSGLEAGMFRRARHRLAGVVLAGLEQREHREAIQACADRGRPPEWENCLGAVMAAKSFHDQASALRDPELMAVARELLDSAVEIGTRYLPAGDQLDSTLAMVRSDLVASGAQETLFRSRRARAAGLTQDADRLARRVLREAEGIPDELFRLFVGCSALVDLGERDAATSAVEAIEPRLSAIAAARLWLRLGEPERAARHLPGIGVHGPGPDQPWELPAIRADLALARHAYDEAARHARQGLGAFEEHRRRLARDALRASSADDPAVAGLQHAAVLALLSSGRPDAVAAAFDQAERGRAGFLDTVRALDAAPPGSAAHTAVRAWLAAEIRWAATFEEQAAALRRRTGEGTRARPGDARTMTAGYAGTTAAGEASAQAARGRIGEVGRGLDEAEAVVRRLVPAALTASHAEGLPDAAAVAAALPAHTLLLTYHVFDDVLVGWALTRATLRHERSARQPHRTVAAARRFHAWCARRDVPGAGDAGGEAAGRELVEALVRPFAEELRDHRRVIVVPPAALALLPFHALPWTGDVPLGVTHDVSYLPAVSLLARRHDRLPERPWAELDALFVGAPATHPRHGLRELPGTAAEVVAAAGLFPQGRALTGAAATRDAVLAATRGCGILHLATHGLIDELAPHCAKLPLADDDELGLADLPAVAQDLQLLVLSGCDTGRGTATAGGDVLGLTRAALITGARHALVSLWPVDDVTGCLVLARTYARMAKEPTVLLGTALAQAQREVRDLPGAARYDEFRELARRAGVRPGPAARAPDRPRSRDSAPLGHGRDGTPHGHPYHWAPFIHVGT
ncbi:CHAT domain-containing protein [Streptomyces caniscabiei]|uniref:CHAT domain-containing protein n=1 Tax=Streptomyces caniscabiei TaxID=2746961 RepID=UPI0038F64483